MTRSRATPRAAGKHPGVVPPSCMIRRASPMLSCIDLYRRTRRSLPECNGCLEPVRCVRRRGPPSRRAVGRPCGPETDRPRRFYHPTAPSEWPHRSAAASGTAGVAHISVLLGPGLGRSRGGRQGRVVVDASSGGPAGCRQASRGSSTVSHDRMSLSDAHLHRSVPSDSS